MVRAMARLYITIDQFQGQAWGTFLTVKQLEEARPIIFEKLVGRPPSETDLNQMEKYFSPPKEILSVPIPGMGDDPDVDL